jgi:hypothetical protein
MRQDGGHASYSSGTGRPMFTERDGKQHSVGFISPTPQQGFGSIRRLELLTRCHSERSEESGVAGLTLPQILRRGVYPEPSPRAPHNDLMLVFVRDF